MSQTQLLQGKLRKSRLRIYASQRDSYRLIEWLNGSKKTKKYARVVRLISDLQRLTKIIDPERISADGEWHWGLNLPKRGYSIREWSAVFKRICRELERHKVFPQLTTYRDGFWFAEWCSNRRKEWLSARWAECRGWSERTSTATDAVVEVVKVATDGFIERIRQCRLCGRWFSAGLKTQVFCSRECQRKHYWSGSSWKAHRRCYMRRYRKIKSLPNVK
jgi:hypothetical protein